MNIAWDKVGLDPIGWAILGVLILLFVVGLYQRTVRQQAPAMMTSVGIFGTFLGIYLAMLPLDFSPRYMNDSVIALVNGMKTAFSTSLMGLFSAVLFRGVVALGWHRRAVDPDQETVLDALAAIRSAIAGDQEESLSNQTSALRLNVRDLLSAVGGEGEGSLAGRLDRLRLDAKDGNDATVQRLDGLREAQVEGFDKLDALTTTIQDALVQSLQDLIADLRDTVGRQLTESLARLTENIERALIEQFGKTFVEFNEATQAIKKWQADHRDQVEELTEAFVRARDGISAIADNCAAIPPTMEKLREGVDVARDDIHALNQQLTAFATMREQAEQAIPTLKAHLDAIGEDLSESATGLKDAKGAIQETVAAAEAEAQRFVRESAERAAALAESMRTAVENAIETSLDSVKRTGEIAITDVQEMAAGIRETIEGAQRESAEQALATVRTTMDAFAQQVRDELQDITRDWGQNLVAIAERCRDLINEMDGRRGRRA